ncbi:MAG: hypothetical protein LKF30_10550 [Sphingobium sp.]|jgi:N-methylhydantoinase A|nr:hypothetical protein [Sphingobium sp.]MCI1270972.1 hypothetical protein [Sphingobium sp.]MCI1756997.1 hypothetical protein [Sphingobium sp.]MCI2052494.1 hypothetical protein [Sphingobium sp.]
MVSAKTPSTPPDYSEGVLNAIDLLAAELGCDVADLLADTDHIAHGTTSSLNALVMGKVPRIGFVTTQGHRDSIFIMNVEGRYLGRPQHELQDIMTQTKPRGLVERRLAREVVERIDRAGTVIVPLNEDDAKAVIREVLAEGVKAIAISLLWSFRNPAHEQRLIALPIRRRLLPFEAERGGHPVRRAQHGSCPGRKRACHHAHRDL